MATENDLLKIGNSPVISASVGLGGRNKPIDVGIVQHLLNCAYPGNSTVNVFAIDGQADNTLSNWITAFQKNEMKLAKPDGVVSASGGTLTALRKKCTGSFLPPLYGPPQFISHWSRMNPETMLKLTALQFGNPALAVSDGLRFLFKKIVADPKVMDLRWGAYMLATAKAETGKFLPIEEYESLWKKSTGKGQYAEELSVTDAAGTTRKLRYYGRGYVQLTWQKNYRSMGEALGLGETLVHAPERALEPEIAYNVASLGMREGRFASDKTGKAMSLPRFIDGANCNYRYARQIINGLDRADEIAGYATAFEVLMLLSTSGPPKPP